MSFRQLRRKYTPEDFPTNLIMLLAGDIETNPGPAAVHCLIFRHLNFLKLFVQEFV